MAGVALLVGGCKIVPASPQAALILLAWLYGAVPGMSYEDYRTAYLAAGGRQVAQVERCFAAWRP